MLFRSNDNYKVTFSTPRYGFKDTLVWYGNIHRNILIQRINAHQVCVCVCMCMCVCVCMCAVCAVACSVYMCACMLYTFLSVQ